MKKIVVIGILGLVSLLILLNVVLNNKSTISTAKIINKEDITILKMAHNLPVNSALHEASVLFAQKVKEKTDNKVQIDIYPKQQLGNDYQMIELTRNGNIDILLTPTAKMSVPVPSMQYADLPFLFPTREDAYELLDGKVGQMILNELNDINLLGIAFWENGFKHFTANEPLLTPRDFKDKKIRVMKSRIIMEQFNALGAKPVAIDFHSTKQALADKVVEGQENPLVAIVNMEFYKEQSDLMISEHAYLPYLFSISKKSLSKLSGNIQDILIESAVEITAWERKETQRREKVFLETIKKSGVKIHTLSKEEKTKFREVTKHISKQYEDVIGSHIISKTEEILFNKYKTDEVIAIGVDADLSMVSKGAGLAIKRGVELAVDEINAKGGLLGKKVVVIAKDHRTVSTQGIKNIKEFSKNSHIKAIIGGKHSSIIDSQMKYIQEAKKPYISPWASAAKIVDNGYQDNYIFRVSANNSYAVKLLLSETLKENKNPLVIVENSIWGRGALDLLKRIDLKRDIDQFNSIVLNRGENDFSNVIKTIKNKGIDSVIMVLNTAESTNVVNAIAINKIKIPIVSHWGMIGNEFYTKNKKYLKDLDLKFIQTFSFENKLNKNADKLRTLYMKKYAKNTIKNIVAPTGLAQAYDAMNLLSIAIQNANSFDGSKIKEQLENISIYNGVIKIYKKPFSSTNHEALDEKDFFFARYNHEGTIVPILKEDR